MKNKVNLIGRLGDNPEIKNFDEGLKIANVKLATSEKYTNKQGEKVEETQWHSLVFFGKKAEIVEKFLNKGDMIDVEGKIKYESYDKDGEKKYFTRIHCSDIVMLGGNRNDSNSNSAMNVPSQQVPSYEDDSNSLPF